LDKYDALTLATVKILSLRKGSSDIDRMEKKWLLYSLNPMSMNLMMFLGNDLIEAIPLEKDSIPVPGYLGHFKRALKEKYREVIQQCPEPPEFLVIEPVKQENKRKHQ
jgi:hypothetical protein